MDLLRKHFLPVFQAPDMPGATPDASVVVPDPALTPEPSIEPSVPGEKTVPVSVMVREISPLRAKVRETEAELANSRRTIAEQNELLSRLQKPGDQQPPVRQVQEPQSDDVDRRAAEIVFQRDAQQVSETGLKTYGQGWVDAVNALNAYGVNSADFVSSVIEIDRAKAHEIMHAIAQDGEKAIALANMSPARRIAEITRMAMAPATEKTPAVEPPKTPVVAKTVSRAPAPPPPVDPSASKVVDWRSDDASDDDFTKGFNEMMTKRSARR